MQVLNTTQLIVEKVAAYNGNISLIKNDLVNHGKLPSEECFDKGVQWLLDMKLVTRQDIPGDSGFIRILHRTLPQPVSTLVGPDVLRFHLLDIICCAMQPVAVVELEQMVRQQGIAVHNTHSLPAMRGDTTLWLVMTQVQLAVNELASAGHITPRSVLLEYQPTFDFDGLPSGHMIAMQPGTEYFATLDGYKFRAEGLGNE